MGGDFGGLANGHGQTVRRFDKCFDVFQPPKRAPLESRHPALEVGAEFGTGGAERHQAGQIGTARMGVKGDWKVVCGTW